MSYSDVEAKEVAAKHWIDLDETLWPAWLAAGCPLRQSAQPNKSHSAHGAEFTLLHKELQDIFG